MGTIFTNLAALPSWELLYRKYYLVSVLNIQKNANYCNKIIKTHAYIRAQTHIRLNIVKMYCYLITASDGTNDLELFLLKDFEYMDTKNFKPKNFGHGIGSKTSMPQNV